MRAARAVVLDSNGTLAEDEALRGGTYEELPIHEGLPATVSATTIGQLGSPAIRAAGDLVGRAGSLSVLRQNTELIGALSRMRTAPACTTLLRCRILP